MNKITALIFSFVACITAIAQTTGKEQLINYATVYKNYMFANDPTKKVLTEFRANVPDSLKIANEFVAQTITKKNMLATDAFLKRPTDKELKHIFIINRVFANMTRESEIGNEQLVDSLLVSNIPVNEMVDNYYTMLFVGVGNKNQPFNLTKLDLKLNSYGLKNDIEKGILFLTCMDMCGTQIWGYMNIVDPPNTKEAMKYIKKYPKVNGATYYQYTDLFFEDFEMELVENEGPESYKRHYINRYFGLLLSHVVCLVDSGASDAELETFLLGTALRNENLYKYTQYEELLKGIYQEQ